MQLSGWTAAQFLSWLLCHLHRSQQCRSCASHPWLRSRLATRCEGSVTQCGLETMGLSVNGWPWNKICRQSSGEALVCAEKQLGGIGFVPRSNLDGTDLCREAPPPKHKHLDSCPTPLVTKSSIERDLGFVHKVATAKHKSLLSGWGASPQKFHYFIVKPFQIQHWLLRLGASTSRTISSAPSFPGLVHGGRAQITVADVGTVLVRNIKTPET